MKQQLVISNLMHLHVSPWANVPSASDGMKHHKAPPPHHHIIFHITLPSHPRVGLRYKNRRVRPRRHVLHWDSQPASVCYQPSTPGRHFVTFSLMNSQMILVISSPSISTTGWATLMRLSASVKSHMHRGSSRDRFFIHNRMWIYLWVHDGWTTNTGSYSDWRFFAEILFPVSFTFAS